MRVNVYIRQEDEQKWADLENKSEFIHNALNGDKLLTTVKDIRSVVVPVDSANPGSDSETPNKKPNPNTGWSGPLMRDKKKGKL